MLLHLSIARFKPRDSTRKYCSLRIHLGIWLFPASSYWGST